jgi:hypothetical protein
MGTTGRSAVAVIAVVSWAGCAVGLQGPPARRPPPPPVVVVVAPPPPAPPPPAQHVPPGQIRAAEVHERNAARKAAHDAEKARRHDRVAQDRDNDDEDDDDHDDDPGHGHGHGHGHGGDR